MKQRTAKRALLMSALSLLLCVSMLVGTTFAWFTDSVTSAGNIIKSGTLDVEMSWAEGKENPATVTWTDAATGAIFNYDKWEPGYTEVRHIKIANVGTLALKYQLQIVATGEVSDLADVIDVYYMDPAKQVANRTQLTEDKKLGTLTEVLAGLSESAYGELLANTEHTVTLALKMQETAGNEYQNKSIGTSFSVVLMATQLTAEEDSFGKDYDQGAPIVSGTIVRPTGAVTLESKEKVQLALPEELVDKLPAAVTEISLAVSEPVVNAAENTITFKSVELVDQDGKVIDTEALDLEEDIIVTLPAQTQFAEGETIAVYHDGEFVASATVGANGVISYPVAHLCEITVAALEEPTVDGAVVKIANASQLFAFAQSVNSGADYYEGKTVVLTADIDLNNTNWTPVGSAAKDHGFMGNFDGKGYKIQNLTINPTVDNSGYAYAGFFGVTEGVDKDNQNSIKNLVIENVTIDTKGHIVSAAVAYPYYTVLENITVCGDIAIKGGDYTAGALAYTRRCVNASKITVKGNKGSYIVGGTTVGGVISDIQMNGGLIADYSNFSVSNITVTGNKCVGGISGIIGGQTLNGAKVENVELVCDDAHVGIVAGAFDSNPSIKDATYANVTGTAAVAGAPYGAASNRNITVDGVDYVTVGTADELIAALESKNNVLFLNDIKIAPASMSNAYGATGINVKYGQTIDGNGYTLDIKGAGGTWDSGINTTGGLIKNITVTGSFRGIFINHTSTYSEKVVLNNVTLDGVTYTISCDQGLYQGIEATNCTFNGWTSFAKTAGEAKFVNCTFGAGNGYKYCRPYSNTELVNCTFCEGYTVDTTRAAVTFTGCENPNK